MRRSCVGLAKILVFTSHRKTGVLTVGLALIGLWDESEPLGSRNRGSILMGPKVLSCTLQITGPDLKRVGSPVVEGSSAYSKLLTWP